MIRRRTFLIGSAVTAASLVFARERASAEVWDKAIEWFIELVKAFPPTIDGIYKGLLRLEGHYRLLVGDTWDQRRNLWKRPLLAQSPILIVEDEPLIALSLKASVEDAGGTVVGPVGSVRAAMALVKTVPTTIVPQVQFLRLY